MPGQISRLVVVAIAICTLCACDEAMLGENAPDLDPPEPVVDLTASPEDGEVLLEWVLPPDEDLASVVIVWKCDEFPASREDGSAAFEGIDTSYRHTSLANGTRYCYVVYCVDEAGNLSDGATVEATPREGDGDDDPADQTAPQPVSGLNAVASDGTVALSWTNPSDDDFVGVVVRWDTVESPPTPADGTLLYEGVENAAAHTSLANGSWYHYSVFAHDVSGNFSAGEMVSARPCVGTPDATWTRVPANPIIDLGESGNLDTTQATRPVVLLMEDGTYRMYYLGNGSGNWDRYVMLATSDDGLTWIKSDINNPIYGVSHEYNGIRGFGSVCRGPDGYRMYYWRYPAYMTGNYIFAASSDDGISWTQHSGSAYNGSVINGFGAPFSYSNNVNSPIVIYDPDAELYKMWYAQSPNDSSYPYRIDYATSSDGLDWTIQSDDNPVLTGSAGEWDADKVLPTCVIKTAPDEYWMWYRGVSGSVAANGVATSPDGIAWTKSDSNPIFPAGDAGEWDDDLIRRIWVVDIGGPFVLYYAGSDGTNARIGAATQ